MKKLSKVIICLVFMMALFCGSAAAATFESCADELKTLGLFKGSDLGYELDRAPKRVEAGTMLLRLLGLEELALAGDCKHPFTDVPEWADKIVGYLYENNLTNGISETLFGSDNTCDARMYVTFVLRALGYSDKDGDFTYAEALEFGVSVGVVDEFILDTEFLRDNMVAVSFLSLHTATADGEYDTLLEKLVADEVVNAESAKTVLDRNQYYAEIQATLPADQINVSYEVKMSAETVSAEMAVKMEYLINIATRVDDDELSMLMDMAVSVMGMSYSQSTYYKDGYIYFYMLGQKLKMQMSQEDALYEFSLQMEDAGGTAATVNSFTPIYTVKAVTKEVEGDYTVYTETSSLAFDAYTKFMSGDYSTYMGNSVAKYYINSDGKMEKMTSDITMLSEGVPVTMHVEMSNFKFGDEVKIVFPEDLGSYTDVTED